MRKGFTLIEILIVIAIIGILAGVILVTTTSARDKALVASGLQTLKSITPYAVDCFTRDGTVNSVTAPTAGDPVCDAEADVVFPVLPSGCVYADQSVADTIVATCGTTSITITCDFANGGNCQ